MIHSIKLTRFKQFRETEIRLQPFSILMGDNNSGKTTVLQALWLALSGLHQGKLIGIDRKTLQTKISSTGYPMYEIPFVPQGDFSGLFYKRISREGQTYDENSGALLQIVDEQQNSYRLHLRELFRNLNFKLLTPAQEIHNPTIQNYAPLYISGFTGLHFQEERMFPAVLEAKAAAGDVNAVIRNIVLDLNLYAPEKYHYLEQLLDEELGFRIKEVRFQENKDRYVFSEYEEQAKLDAVGLEFASSGSGIMQILQVLALILRYCPEKTKVVLIDEPDAHLQEDMQVKFAEILKKMQQELGIQIILATHSSAIIRNAELDEVIPMLPYASVNKPLRKAGQVKYGQENAVQAYMDELPICGLDAYEIGRAKINGKLVFFEDKALRFLKKKARELQISCFAGNSTVPMVGGWRKGDPEPFAAGELLRKATGRSVDIHLVCCMEGMKEEELTKLKEQAKETEAALHTISMQDSDETWTDVLRALKAEEKIYREEELQEEQDAEVKMRRRDYEQLTLLDLS